MKQMWRRLQRFREDRRGAVTLLTAGSLTTLLGMLAFAVDMGSAYLDSRRLQGIADAAALAAVATNGDESSAAQAAIGASGWSKPFTMTLNGGTYTPDPTLAPSARFTPGVGSGAARVTINSSVPLYFASLLVGRNRAAVARSATAARVDAAAFSLGTRLAAVNGGIANALLTALTGSNVNLSVMDYNALLNADVDIFSFSNALRTQLNLTGASYDTTLATTASMPQVLNALASALGLGGDSAAATAVTKIAGSAGNVASVQLSNIINLGSMGVQDHVAGGTSAMVNAFDLAQTALSLANGSRQVQLNLGAQIPGLLTTKVWLAIGQPMSSSPWLTMTNTDTPVIHTAQTRLYVQGQVAANPALAALGFGPITLPVYTELAAAQAKLHSITCGAGGSNASVALDVMPSLGHASIATINTSGLANFTTPVTETPVTIVSAPLASVTGQARADLGGTSWQTVNFSASDIAAGSVKTVQTNDITTALTSSLVKNMNLNVNLLGLGLNLNTVTSLVGSALTPIAPALDGVINSLTGLLGVHLGEADARVDGVRCGVPALVA